MLTKLPSTPTPHTGSTHPLFFVWQHYLHCLEKNSTGYWLNCHYQFLKQRKNTMIEDEPSHVKQTSSNDVCTKGLYCHYLFKKRKENSMVEEPSHVKQPSSNDVCKIGLNRHCLLKKLKENRMVEEPSLNHGCKK
jgi:hypothetical protein